MRQIVYGRLRSSYNGQLSSKLYAWKTCDDKDYSNESYAVADAGGILQVAKIEKVEPWSSDVEAKKYVVGPINMDAYNTARQNEKEAANLKAKMDLKIKQMPNMSAYEIYAQYDPEIRQILDQYQTLV